MNALQAALASLADTIETLPKFMVLPPEARRPTHVAMLAITGGNVTEPGKAPTDRLKQVWQQLKEAHRSGQDYLALPPSTLRDASWLLWASEWNGHSLPGLRDALMARAGERTSALRRLLQAWLLQFDPAHADIQSAGPRLAAILQGASAPSLREWQDMQQEFQLLQPGGPARLATLMHKDEASKVLARYRVDTPMRATSGYLRAATISFCIGLPRRLRAPMPRPAQEAAQAFLAPGGMLRFDEPALRGALADGLVGAWSEGRGPDEIRQDTLEFLRTHLGDPRIKPALWADAKPETRAIVRGWLAELSLEAFFGVIGQFANGAGYDEHWTARRRFWSACLKKRWISDAWLVLGENVADNVKGNRRIKDTYGLLDRVKSKNHSALIMRIGGIVFVEWSFNGKLVAWKAIDSKVPKMYYTGYYTNADFPPTSLRFPAPVSRPDLGESGVDGITHHQGTWQRRVAALLRRHENLVMNQADWT